MNNEMSIIYPYTYIERVKSQTFSAVDSKDAPNLSAGLAVLKDTASWESQFYTLTMTVDVLLRITCYILCYSNSKGRLV